MGQSLTDRQSIAATTTVENILANKAFAILTQNSLLTVAITASLISAFVTIVIGRQVVVDGQEIPDTAAAPRRYEDQIVSEFGERADQISIRVRNDNAAANVIRTLVIIDPI